MKRKKIMPMGIICMFMLLGIWNTPSYAYAKSPTSFEICTEATVRASNIEWRYKMEDGKLYKRLYNYTTQKWIGDWELVS